MKPSRLALTLAITLSLSCGGPEKSSRLASTLATESESARSRYTAEQFFETLSIRGTSFSHDESRLLVSSDESGVYNVYAQPITGGARTALTQSVDNATYAVSYFPADDRFLYSADQGGNELNHLFVMSEEGSSKDLTPSERTKSSFLGWSGDKSSFWVLSNERDPKGFDLYQYQTSGYQRKLVFQNEEAWTVEAVSPNGAWVALTKVESNVESNVYLWNAHKPKHKPTLVTPHKGDVSTSAMTFTRDSTSLLYSTDQHSDFKEIWSVDLATQEHSLHTKAGWDVSYVGYSETGKYQIAAINADARTIIRVIDTASGTPLALPELPEGDLSSPRFSPSEGKMVFSLSQDRSSPNMYMVDLASQDLVQLTDTMNKAIASEKLVDVEVLRFPSFDELPIPALLYKPKGASPDAKVPVMIFLHGGPGGQSRLGYRPDLQHLANHGYAILAVNNRGSSGYGKNFYHADDRKHGDVDLKDCVWARKYLETLDWVDSNRIGIMGGSYGGYLVLAALAFHPEVFDVGIDIFGISNWIRTLESIPPWWASFAKYLYAEVGHPVKDAERLKAFSPLLHANQIVKPLLVIQGANDPRVLKAESDEIVAAVKANGVPVDYVLFPDEGHGFRKRENRIKASNAYLKFLETHLVP